MSGVESVVIRDVLAMVGVIVLMAVAAGVHYVSAVQDARRLHEALRAKLDDLREARLEQRRR